MRFMSAEEKLRQAGWFQVEGGLWTAKGVAVPMRLSGALIVLAAAEASPADGVRRG